MSQSVSLNEIAIQVREETQRAVADYEDPLGVTVNAIKTLKIVLSKSRKLSKFKDETVVICELNLAAAYIGTMERRAEGERMLKELQKKEEAKTPKDNILLAYIFYHLGLVSESRKNNASSKESSAVSLLEELDEQRKCLEKALEYLKAEKEKEKENVEEERNPETQIEFLILKERTLERIIHIFVEKGKRLEQDSEKVENEKQKVDRMKQLCHVYEDLYEEAEKPENNIPERPEDILAKRVDKSLYLATSHVHSNRYRAKFWADKCFEIFDEDWTRVPASTCSDLGIVYTEIKEYERAKECFLKTQVCSQGDKSSHEVDKSYMFQNLGSVHVLQNKYDVAIHYFNEALNLLDGNRNLSERRAHLYLNLGFAWSQTGRGNIWKTFEAYYNAALLARVCKDELKLRRAALKGMSLAAIVITDDKDKGSAEKPGVTNFEDIPEISNEALKEDSKYESYINKLKKTVLAQKLQEDV